MKKLNNAKVRKIETRIIYLELNTVIDSVVNHDENNLSENEITTMLLNCINAITGQDYVLVKHEK